MIVSFDRTPQWTTSIITPQESNVRMRLTPAMINLIPMLLRSLRSRFFRRHRSFMLYYLSAPANKKAYISTTLSTKQYGGVVLTIDSGKTVLSPASYLSFPAPH